ncbi:MAG: 50S ribosomal protein L18 [Clostridiaceae bacterium]|jgi:large subunit ribosomal protein L18|nr:50S ribosomal protein L18 [Bacillota bacterium]NLN51790.1 50S ribosomal protein L18 [Clostridiaceae bacterium]
MIKKTQKNKIRQRKHARVREHISGTGERPRLSVYRSLSHIYAQVIDDITGTTLVAASSLDSEIKEQTNNTSNREAAKLVGELIAKRSLEKDIENVVFDRSGYIFHGRVAALAEGAREAGLKF